MPHETQRLGLPEPAWLRPQHVDVLSLLIKYFLIWSATKQLCCFSVFYLLSPLLQLMVCWHRCDLFFW